MSLVDSSYNKESKASCLVSKGVNTYIRYYNFSNSSYFQNKRLELVNA